MDPRQIGAVIRRLRNDRGLTQLLLAERLHVSDRTVSKWERGAGLPDIGMLNALAKELGVRVEDLLAGSLPENESIGGNMKRSAFYACAACGNVVMSASPASIACCGRTLEPLHMDKPDPAHAPHIEPIDGERYITFDHPMEKEHYISFIAFLTPSEARLIRQYPEWAAQARIPARGRGRLVWHCVKDGLFYMDL